MARTRNEHYEYVERDGLFRKRVKDATGKYVAIYGETPEDVTKQLIDFYEQRDIDAEEMKDPLFSVYARRWLELNCGNLTKATQKGYLTVLNNHIIPFLDDLRMNEIRPRDIKVVITRAGQMSESVHNKTYMLLKRILTTACIASRGKFTILERLIRYMDRIRPDRVALIRLSGNPSDPKLPSKIILICPLV